MNNKNKSKDVKFVSFNQYVTDLNKVGHAYTLYKAFKYRSKCN